MDVASYALTPPLLKSGRRRRRRRSAGMSYRMGMGSLARVCVQRRLIPCTFISSQRHQRRGTAVDVTPIIHTVLSGVALQSFKATRALKLKEYSYGRECRHSFAARLFSSDTSALLPIIDPDVKQAVKNLLASSWDELRDSIRSDVMYALSKETDDTVGQEALANAWRAAEAVEQFGGVLLSLRMELDELSGSSGENVRPLSEELQGALRAAYKCYNTYLDAFGPDEAYLRKKVEIELGTKMIHIKMRCSGLDSEWGKITALGTSGLSGSYIEHRAA